MSKEIDKLLAEEIDNIQGQIDNLTRIRDNYRNKRINNWIDDHTHIGQLGESGLRIIHYKKKKWILHLVPHEEDPGYSIGLTEINAPFNKITIEF